MASLSKSKGELIRGWMTPEHQQAKSAARMQLGLDAVFAFLPMMLGMPPILPPRGRAWAAKEMKYARSIHRDYAKKSIDPKEAKVIGDVEHHGKTIETKNTVMEALMGRGDKKKALKILDGYLDSHRPWVEYAEKYPNAHPEAGDANWHRRWIEVYERAKEIILKK